MDAIEHAAPDMVASFSAYIYSEQYDGVNLMVSEARPHICAGHIFWSATLVCLLLAGCGTSEFPDTYPVSGTILLPDGTPLKGGIIEFESITDPNMRALGDIDQDGSFASVFTYKSSGREVEGLIAGEHRVRFELAPGDDAEGGVAPRRKSPLVDSRYRSFDTSNLKCTIPAPDNRLSIRLEKAAR